MTQGAPLYSVDGAAAPSGGRAFFVNTDDEKRLRVAYWPGIGRGFALILQGRTEFIEKYYGVISQLRDLGFSVGAVDWRGQGLSTRALEDPRKGFVEDFAEYQKDLDIAMNALREQGAPAADKAPWIMVAHSMGGAIGARALMRQAKKVKKGPDASSPPVKFSAVVYSAPMFRLSGGPMRHLAMRLACRLSGMAGRGRFYVPGVEDETAADLGFEDNVLTSDEDQFNLYARFLDQYPELALGAATWSWLNAALYAMRSLRPTSTPALAILGDDDTVVDNAAARTFLDAIPGGEVLPLPKARHEPFIETPVLREKIWTAVAEFLEKNDL
ncbi:MAG: alpha/beta hydrolase [Neomegalonema sp.]|nr:alpha/beta hydrolase [Neomegalonema sp.]